MFDVGSDVKSKSRQPYTLTLTPDIKHELCIQCFIHTTKVHDVRPLLGLLFRLPKIIDPYKAHGGSLIVSRSSLSIGMIGVSEYRLSCQNIGVSEQLLSVSEYRAVTS